MFRQHSKLALRTTAIAATAGWLCLQPLASTAVAATLTAQQVSQFEANPAAALTQFSGAELISYIRDLVLTDPAALNPIIGLIPTATPEQQTAIGTGLGQAAQSLARTNPALANLIQQSLIACGSGIPQPGRRSPCENAVLAFAGVTGNAAITAAGGGGGGGGGGGSGVGPVVNGPPLGGFNSSTLPNGGPFTTGGFTFPGGFVTGGGGGGGGNTTTIVTITETSQF